MRLTSQNLNEKRGGITGPKFFHGRAWLRFERRMPSLAFEWVHFERAEELRAALALSFERDGRELQLHVRAPWLFSYFITAEGMPAWLFDRLPFNHLRSDWDYAGGNRSVGLRIFDAAIWWSIWEDEHEKRNTDPKWMSGRIGLREIAKALLGRERYVERTIEERDVVIPMPECAYPAKAKLYEARWIRERWPHWPLLRSMMKTSIETKDGVPVPGKGENSWDIGPDAIYSRHTADSTIEEAIGGFVASALGVRKRRGVRADYAERDRPREAKG